MGYTYRGTQFDANEPITEPLPKSAGEERRATCGTRAGYRAHRKADETPCDPCRAANTAYTKEYAIRRKARAIKKGWTNAKCGTLAGYGSHRWFAMPMCEPCRQANIDYCREHREAKRAA